MLKAVTRSSIAGPGADSDDANRQSDMSSGQTPSSIRTILSDCCGLMALQPFVARSDPRLGQSDVERKSWFRGYEDMPGYCHVEQISPLLFVGNARSAACGEFDAVISTVTPLSRNGDPAPELSTSELKFEDQQGAESEKDAAAARQYIIRGAAVLASSIDEGRRTLVHCEWGQNRSGAICCAYAVLFGGWSAADAMEYFRSCNRRDRCYLGQMPMHNQVFNGIIHQLEEYRQGLTPDQLTLLRRCGVV